MDTLHALPHDPYREVLSLLDTLLRNIYSSIAASGPAVLTKAVSSDIKQRLITSCALSFDIDNALPSTFAFLKQYAEAFHRDFNPILYCPSSASASASSATTVTTATPNPEFPDCVQTLLQRLLLWKELLLNHIRTHHPRHAGSEVRPRFHPYIIDLPTMYTTGYETSFMFNPVLELTSVEPHLYVHRHAYRYLELRDEQSNVFRYYLEPISNIDAVLEERSLNFQVFFHMIVANSPTAQARHLKMTLPSFVHISPTLRLVRTSVHEESLEGVYRQKFGAAYDQKQAEFALRLYFHDNNNQNIPAGMEDWVQQVKPSQIFESVCSKTLLSEYM